MLIDRSSKNGDRDKNSLGAVILVFFLSLLQLACISFPALASPRAERQTLSLTEDREKDLKRLSELCFFNDLTSADVLWANDLSADRLTEGTTLVIPASRQDILAVWQSVQKQRKPASYTLVSIKLHGVPKYADKVADPVIEANEPSPSFPSSTVQPNPNKAAGSFKTAPQSETTGKKRETAEKKEPVLFLAPEGDASSGPMRLIVSGDRIDIVRLPRTQTPRMPNPSDIQRSLFPGASPQESISPKVSPSGAKMIWPVSGTVSSGFGKRGKRAYHAGIDIPMPKGTSIKAAKDGVVKQVVSVKTRGFRGYGNVILLDHGKGISTLYAHCHTVKVKQGQRVRQGETIATVGRTGRATTNHLHFEVRLNGKPVNPVPYLPSGR
mgnify:CR=1 FL=1